MYCLRYEACSKEFGRQGYNVRHEHLYFSSVTYKQRILWLIASATGKRTKKSQRSLRSRVRQRCATRARARGTRCSATALLMHVEAALPTPLFRTLIQQKAVLKVESCSLINSRLHFQCNHT